VFLGQRAAGASPPLEIQETETMASQSTLKDVFMEELRDVLNAEKQLTKALPKMARAASNEQLREAFQEHLDQTKGQIERIEQAFESLDVKPRSKKCAAMEGLIEEGSEHLEEDAEPDALDALLIAAAQKVEHYEIATYGSLCTWGELLGYEEATDLLKQNLAEEKETDARLTEIAYEINRAAMSVESAE
jgi:ferritin-like metal-binding protein YciE